MRSTVQIEPMSNTYQAQHREQFRSYCELRRRFSIPLWPHLPGPFSPGSWWIGEFGRITSSESFVNSKLHHFQCFGIAMFHCEKRAC